MSVEDLDASLAINVRGVFLCYRYAAIQMIAQGRGGRIIGAASIAGRVGVLVSSTFFQQSDIHKRLVGQQRVFRIEIRRAGFDPSCRHVESSFNIIDIRD